MAGFFDTLLGGGAEREANEKNQALYGQYKSEATGYLGGGLDKSLASLGQGYGGANTTLGQNKDVFSQYNDRANGVLNTGLYNSVGSLNSAKSAYEPLAALGAKYGAGTGLYLDSLGVNGAAGNQNAVNSFQAGPGYQFQMDQGNDAINRRRAAGGMLNSGNADIDALKFGQGLANQEYGNWQTKLSGLINPELSATSGAATGRAGVDAQMAGLYGQDAASRVGVAGNVANGTAGVNSAMAGNQVGLGAGQAGLYTQNASDLTSLASGVTSGMTAGNNMQAAGASQGARNVLGAGMSLASLAAGSGGGFGGLGGAMGGGSGIGSTLGSMGITYGMPGTAGSNMYGPVR